MSEGLLHTQGISSQVPWRFELNYIEEGFVQLFLGIDTKQFKQMVPSLFTSASFKSQCLGRCVFLSVSCPPRTMPEFLGQ